MSPFTHLLASWIVAAKTTDNLRDCRLITLAGILPDADGLGLLGDLVNQRIAHADGFPLYATWHHYLLHGLFGAVLIVLGTAALASAIQRALQPDARPS